MQDLYIMPIIALIFRWWNMGKMLRPVTRLINSWIQEIIACLEIDLCQHSSPIESYDYISFQCRLALTFHSRSCITFCSSLWEHIGYVWWKICRCWWLALVFKSIIEYEHSLWKINAYIFTFLCARIRIICHSLCTL